MQRLPSLQVVPLETLAVPHAPALHVAVWHVPDEHAVQVVAPQP